MSLEPMRIGLCEFVRELSRTPVIGRDFRIVGMASSFELPVKLYDHASGIGGTNPLVVTFHGGVNRDTRPIPVFQSTLAPCDGRATVLALADPSLPLAPSLAQAWYAANAKAPVPAIIAEMLDAVIAEIQPSRLIFASGSAGGHAALFHSFQHPDSVCIVQNPLSCISRYEQRRISEYRQACWPDLPADAPLSTVMQDDVGELYRQGHRNSVIWLQNALDPLIPRQLAHFLRDIVARDKFLLLSEYFPNFASHSYPRRVWASWIEAAIEASSTSVSDIASVASDLLAAIEGGRNDKPASMLESIDAGPMEINSDQPVKEPAGNDIASPAESRVPNAERDKEIAQQIFAWSVTGSRGR